MNLLTEIINILTARAETIRADGEMSMAFMAWTGSKLVSPADIEAERNRCVGLTGAQRRYSDVASLGFLQSLYSEDAEVRERLEDGLKWMTGRSIRSEGQYADFCSDSLALLGIALGARSTPATPSTSTWLKAVLDADTGTQAEWDVSVRELAKLVAGYAATKALVAQIAVLAFSKGMSVEPLDGKDTERVIALLRVGSISRMSDAEAVTLLFAFNFLEASQPLLALQAPSVASVSSVLANIKNGLTRWTWESKAKTTGAEPRQWHLDNEYHFQNLLWFTLRPLFPDAKEEEYKSAVGRVHPRLDIVLPSLRLIVEAKFWRTRDSSKEMVREIAEDSGLYLTVSKPYDSIIPVIWDNGRRVEEHDSLKQALLEIEGIVDPVIISRPSFMG